MKSRSCFSTHHRPYSRAAMMVKLGGRRRLWRRSWVGTCATRPRGPRYVCRTSICTKIVTFWTQTLLVRAHIKTLHKKRLLRTRHLGVLTLKSVYGTSLSRAPGYGVCTVPELAGEHGVLGPKNTWIPVLHT